MNAKGKRYDVELKTKLVLALLRGEESQEALARRHQISGTALSRWKEQFIEGGVRGLQHNGQDLKRAGEVHQLQRELSERDRVIGELTVANQLLKKSAWGI
jgi:transposase-like protein